MFSYYKDFWVKYIDFKGISSRSEYWYVYLVNMIIFSAVSLVPLTIFSVTDFGKNSPQIWGPALGLMVLYLLAIVIPSLAIIIRRLRDGGFHWAFIFFKFIPYIGGLILFIFLLMPTKETNIVINKTDEPERDPSVNV